MDVRCERCRAQYVFDDDQVTPSGLTVQCTNCGHVFRVKVKELVVTVPVKPGELDAAPIPATAAAPKPSAGPGGASPEAPPPAADEKPKEWRVRRADGSLLAFKELTTLQKWIVEQKVSRDDELSLSGDEWKRLGNIGDLETFFQVVEAAGKAKAQPELPAVPPPVAAADPSPPLPPPPSHPPGYGAPFLPLPVFAPAHVPAPPPTPPPAPAPAPHPAPAPVARMTPPRPAARSAVDVPLDDAELVAPKRGGAGKVAVLLLVAALAAGAGIYALRPSLLGLGPARAPESLAVPLTFDVRAPVKVAPAGDPVPPEERGSPGAEPSAAGPQEAAPLPAPVPVGDAPLPKAPVPMVRADAVTVTPPAAPKGPRGLLADARRLRERGAVEKALELYERAVDALPGNARALAGRGLCYLDLQQYGLAEQSFRAALRSEPEDEEALLGLAEASRYQGKRSEAIQQYERYLALHPGGEDAVAARNAISQLKE